MYIGMSYINGNFISHKADFSKIDPSNEKEIGVFPISGIRVVESAVEAAKTAFKKWRQVSRVERATYFEELVYLLKARKYDFVNAISKETGKTLNESEAEFNESLHMAQYTFGMGRMPVGQIMPSEIADKDTYCIRKPKGVVAVISPWNFPMAIGGFWCAAPAILEGNCVVLKPSEDAPILGQLIAEVYHYAKFPPGVFNMIHGGGYTGDILAKDEGVNHICFTGSAAVGQLIQKICANDFFGKSCSCEMGSKSAMIICEDADYNLALESCLTSSYKLSGQRCVSAGRLLVHNKLFDKFVVDFVKRSQNLKIGSPMEGSFDMGPLINNKRS